MKFSNLFRFKKWVEWYLGTNAAQKLSDEKYIKIKYRNIMGKKLDLSNPQNYSEKLQWLKLYDRNPDYTDMVDKFEAKKYVANIIGDEYIIPTIGVWDRFEDIDFDSLPDQFVLKCTHDSGGLVICKDKSKLDINATKEKINSSLKRNYFWHSREWPYKNIKPRIICEKFMQDSSGALIDYKIMCFNGKADCVMLCLDRHLGATKFYYFDKNWDLKRYNLTGARAPENFTIRKPQCMDKMFELAEVLSRGIPHLRVDFYEVNEKIYFGELTFCAASGYNFKLYPEAQAHFGNLIDLDLIKKT